MNIQWKQPNRFGMPAVEPEEKPLRRCREEQETRQFIGFTRHQERAHSDAHGESSDAAMSKWQPKAHFRY